MPVHETGPAGTNAGAAPAARPHADDARTIEERTAALEARLERQPEDLQGWVLLARTHVAQRRFDAAARALERALALSPGHPDLLADLADALAMTQQGSLAGRPMELVRQALAAQPDHPKAQALAATDAINRPPPAAPQRFSVQGTVSVEGAARQALAAQPPSAQAALFIILREAGRTGQPLAVRRYAGDELQPWLRGSPQATWPFAVDERHLMAAGRAPAAGAALTVEARLSLQGQAARGAGDLVGAPQALEPSKAGPLVAALRLSDVAR